MSKSYFPEHDKLYAVQEKIDAINDFLLWLKDEHSVRLYEYDRHTRTNEMSRLGPLNGVYRNGFLLQHFGINEKALQDEKQIMAEHLDRSGNYA